MRKEENKMTLRDIFNRLAWFLMLFDRLEEDIQRNGMTRRSSELKVVYLLRDFKTWSNEVSDFVMTQYGIPAAIGKLNTRKLLIGEDDYIEEKLFNGWLDSETSDDNVSQRYHYRHCNICKKYWDTRDREANITYIKYADLKSMGYDKIAHDFCPKCIDKKFTNK